MVSVKSILENMAWIEEVHPNGDDRWNTLKGILQGLDTRSPTLRAAVQSEQDQTYIGGLQADWIEEDGKLTMITVKPSDPNRSAGG